MVPHQVSAITQLLKTLLDTSIADDDKQSAQLITIMETLRTMDTTTEAIRAEVATLTTNVADLKTDVTALRDAVDTYQTANAAADAAMTEMIATLKSTGSPEQAAALQQIKDDIAAANAALLEARAGVTSATGVVIDTPIPDIGGL